MPIGVLEDRLLGSIDLEESIRTGKASFQPGASRVSRHTHTHTHTLTYTHTH